MTITVPAKQPRKHEETWTVLFYGWNKWRAAVSTQISAEQALLKYEMQFLSGYREGYEYAWLTFPMVVIYRKGRVKRLEYCRDTSPDILHKIHNQPDFKGYFKNLKL
jgi:hypothetical protein